MRTQCPDCGQKYDDTYHWTLCPHDYFEMRTVSVNANGDVKMCNSVEQLRRHMEEKPRREHVHGI